MRGIIATVLILFVAGWLAANVRLPGARSENRPVPQFDHQAGDDWRRTADGWERSSQWRLLAERADYRPIVARIHPVVVALFELLVSMLALILVPRVGGARQTRLQRKRLVRQ